MLTLVTNLGNNIKEDDMKFCVTEWRRMYDNVHALGKMLTDARPTYDEKLNYYPPKTNLSKCAQDGLENDIRRQIERSKYYLNQCGLRMPRPLWKYDYKDETTHASSPKFIYQHLLPVAE